MIIITQIAGLVAPISQCALTNLVHHFGALATWGRAPWLCTILVHWLLRGGRRGYAPYWCVRPHYLSGVLFFRHTPQIGFQGVGARGPLPNLKFVKPTVFPMILREKFFYFFQ